MECGRARESPNAGANNVPTERDFTARRGCSSEVRRVIVPRVSFGTPARRGREVTATKRALGGEIGHRLPRGRS